MSYYYYYYYYYLFLIKYFVIKNNYKINLSKKNECKRILFLIIIWVGGEGVDDGRGELNKKLLRINRSTNCEPWNCGFCTPISRLLKIIRIFINMRKI